MLTDFAQVEYFEKKLLTRREEEDIIRFIPKEAPLAQLVEHLTLNQGVQGSSP